MKRHYLSVFALFVMILFAFGSVDTEDTGDDPLDFGIDSSSDDDSSSDSSGITKAAYDRIDTGMSYSEVVGIIGTSGEEQSRNKIDAVPGVMESVETIMYSWQNSDGSNMNAMFQNDKLIQKAQFGLK